MFKFPLLDILMSDMTKKYQQNVRVPLQTFWFNMKFQQNASKFLLMEKTETYQVCEVQDICNHLIEYLALNRRVNTSWQI